MKILVKTGKTIKVDPSNVLGFRKFIKEYIHWDPEDYMNKLNEVMPNSYKELLHISIPVNTLILPTYMIKHVPKVLKTFLKPKRRDVIYPENFSYFDFYQLVDHPNGVITDSKLTIAVGYDGNKKPVTIRYMYLDIETEKLSFGFPALTFSTDFRDWFVSDKTFKSFLDTLMWARGRKYPDLSDEYSILLKKLRIIEESLTVFLNFFYILHTFNFDNMNYITDWLFKNYSDIIKGYGCDFEEVLDTMEFIFSLASYKH
jgi:hypothetical protein